jgi:hypothetical protein
MNEAKQPECIHDLQVIGGSAHHGKDYTHVYEITWCPRCDHYFGRNTTFLCGIQGRSVDEAKRREYDAEVRRVMIVQTHKKAQRLARAEDSASEQPWYFHGDWTGQEKGDMETLVGLLYGDMTGNWWFLYATKGAVPLYAACLSVGVDREVLWGNTLASLGDELRAYVRGVDVLGALRASKVPPPVTEPAAVRRRVVKRGR